MKLRNYAISIDFKALRNKNDEVVDEFSYDLKYNFSLYKKTGSGNYDETIYKNIPETMKIDCGKVKKDKNNFCGSKKLLHYNNVKTGDYMIQFDFKDVKNFDKMFYAFEFRTRTFNAKFIIFDICLRYVFIAIAAVVLGFYFRNLKKYWTSRNFEQHYIAF